MVTFTGLGTALVTPFREGSVDYVAYKNLVERQIAGDVDFLVALGTTAETPCLTPDEKRLIVETTRSAYSGPLMVGVGTNSLLGTVSNIRLLENYDIDAWLVVAPYYNKPMQNGLYQYFKAVAEETDKDIFIYNVPGRTGVNIHPETTARLAELSNIKGIKEACSEPSHCALLKEIVPPDFITLSGNDDQWFTMMSNGYQGIISVVANIVPQRMSQAVHAMQNGDIDTASKLNKELEELYEVCFVESNPIPVKGGMSLLGLCSAEMRLPMTPATDKTLGLLGDCIFKLSNKPL